MPGRPKYLNAAAIAWGLCTLVAPHAQAAKPPKPEFAGQRHQAHAARAKTPARKRRNDAPNQRTVDAPARFVEVTKALAHGGPPAWDPSMGAPVASTPWALTSAQASARLRTPLGLHLFKRPTWTVAVAPPRAAKIALARRATEAMLAYVRGEPQAQRVEASFAYGTSARLLADLTDAMGEEAMDRAGGPLVWPRIPPGAPVPSRAQLLSGLLDHLTHLDDLAAGRRAGLPPKWAVLGVDVHVAALVAHIASQPVKTSPDRDVSDLGWLEIYPGDAAAAAGLAQGSHFYQVAHGARVVDVQPSFNAALGLTRWQVTVEREGKREQHYYDGIITP